MADYLEDLSIEYEHPYVAVIVQDNTVRYNETTTAVETRDFNGIQVGFFPDGRDGTLLYCVSTTAATNEFGMPNYKTHGQAGYNAVNALSTDRCGMYLMNLKPDDATFANVVFMVKARIVTGGASQVPGGAVDGISVLAENTADDGTKPVMRVSFATTHIEGATTEAELRAELSKLYTGELDDEGNICLPLMAFWRLGRGVNGNNIRIRLTDTTEYDYEPKTHQYQIQVLQPGTTGLAIVERKSGVFNDSAIDLYNTENPSMFIEDVVNDIEYGSTKINMLFDMDSYEAFIDMYNSVNEKDKKTTETFDIIFGKLLSGLDDPNMLIVDDGSGAGLFTIEGLRLAGGSDGSLDGPNKEEVKKQLLIKAFNGEIDPRIKSRFSTPADFQLDANYDNDVKRAMVGLATRRMYDLMTYLDTGLLETNTEIINWGKDMYDVYGYNVVKEAGCYKYRDLRYTGKTIPMTITHFLAKALPNHMAVYGLTEPFAKELARLSSKPVANQPSVSALEANVPDFVKGTFRPVIDPDMDDVKKEYHKFGINCYETVDFYTMQRSDGITTCRENSDRQLEFNEYIIHKAIKIGYSIISSKVFKMGEEADRQRYEKHASQEIEFQLGDVVRSCEVKFIMTQKDAKKRLMRLQMTLVLRKVITKGALVLIIDPNSDEVMITSSEVTTS
ncbi:MAG: hypothetical protein NC548_27765 [Lachnospiraceae bacterium]|nr:hypothetical protein [Lachnospiraceae bacterium]